MKNIESYSFDKIIKYYDDLSKNGLFSYENKIINNFFCKPANVLDIGCGTGRTTVVLRNMGYDVVGIDFSAKMIEMAKRNAPYIKYEIQDVRNLSFDSELFDYAFFSFNGLMLLETYKDRKKAVLEIARVLRDEGLFFFTTPFIDNKIDTKYWKEKKKLFQKSFENFTEEEYLNFGDEVTDEDGIEFHLHIPFLKEIYKLMDECNFEILFSKRRLDAFMEEIHESELDDNYLWVVKKKNVLV